MDNLAVFVHFNSISVISGQRAGEYDGLEPTTPWSEVGNAILLLMQLELPENA